jgi:hypothetical protein
MNRMRKCNDEVYQLAKDQALVKKLKNKRFRPFCLCLPGVMFVTRGSKDSLFFLSLIFFTTWIVVNDINFESAKVFQWVPRRHKVLTHGQERLFRKVISVSIHSSVSNHSTKFSSHRGTLSMSNKVPRWDENFVILRSV